MTDSGFGRYPYNSHDAEITFSPLSRTRISLLCLWWFFTPEKSKSWKGSRNLRDEFSFGCDFQHSFELPK